MATNWTPTIPRQTHTATDWLHLAMRQVGVWYARARERHALAQLDARMLRDIGLTEAQAQDEASKPFWAR
ncbi:MAG: DUF1127 domain-containing protein [Geminicoccaceae bacterium]|nr:MAG: DUF1127 domain-containing protein [Geminicoccaceae bacterium]